MHDLSVLSQSPSNAAGCEYPSSTGLDTSSSNNTIGHSHSPPLGGVGAGDDSDSNEEHDPLPMRRKKVSSLRPMSSLPVANASRGGPRQINSVSRYVPQRVKKSQAGYLLKPSSLDRFIEGKSEATYGSSVPPNYTWPRVLHDIRFLALSAQGCVPGANCSCFRCLVSHIRDQ